MSAASKESDEECETAGTSSMMESTMMEGEEYYHPETTVAWTEKASGSDQLCRICANANEYLIPIFSGEGAEHQLGMKIDKHLPIQVVKQDKLPLHVCYQCASTLIAWHDLHMGCVEAEKKLRQMFQQREEEADHDSDDDDKADDFYSEPMESEMTEDPLEPSTSAASKPTRPTRSPRKKTVTKAKPKLKLTLVKTPVAILPKGTPKLLQPKEEQTDPDPASERFRPVLPSGLFRRPNSVIPLARQALVPAAVTIRWSPRKFECDICHRVVKSKHKLTDHRRTHTGEKPYTCHVCGKQFAGNAGLWRHVKSVHDNVKDCVCDVCGKAYKTNRDLNDHRRSHTGETPFVCEMCGKAYKTSATLYLHKQSHSDVRPFACGRCDKRFKRSSHLAIHVRRAHTLEKPHACEVCAKCFVSYSELAKHGAIHSQAEPFACKQCGVRFRVKRCLVNHEKFHQKNSA